MSTAAVIGAAVFAAALLFLCVLLVKRLNGGAMSGNAKRGLIALAVFAAIFWLSPILTKNNVYDIRMEMARLAIAVLGAGLYWVGSRN